MFRERISNLLGTTEDEEGSPFNEWKNVSIVSVSFGMFGGALVITLYDSNEESIMTFSGGMVRNIQTMGRGLPEVDDFQADFWHADDMDDTGFRLWFKTPIWVILDREDNILILRRME